MGMRAADSQVPCSFSVAAKFQTMDNKRMLATEHSSRLPAQQPAVPARTRAGHTFFGEIRRHWQLYAMALPAIAAVFVFGYAPLVGIVIALMVRRKG